MDTLLARYMFLLFNRIISSWIVIAYISNLQNWLVWQVQMNLGTAFGAFLDPVADKVFSLYSSIHMDIA